MWRRVHDALAPKSDIPHENLYLRLDHRIIRCDQKSDVYVAPYLEFRYTNKTNMHTHKNAKRYELDRNNAQWKRYGEELART